MQTRTIAIVGAGFSGTAAAVHLLRGDVSPPTHVVLINRSGPTARGVAYGTRSDSHVLNVPAAQMSAFPDDEESFLRFARLHDPSIVAGSFAPRRLYGQYLEQILHTAEREATTATLEHYVGEAKAISVVPDGESARITFADGRHLHAERVILALGNYAPANPPIGDTTFFESPRYVRDPWMRGALGVVAKDDSVLYIGTGLTTIDIALELRNRGVRGTMNAVSRRGLLPQPHRSPGAPPSHAHLPPDIFEKPATAREYLRAVREHVRRLAAQGVDWREVIGSLRPVTPQLWDRLSTTERARFLRHLRPYWEVHRHRVAPEPAAAFMQMVQDGQIIVHAGRITRFDVDDDYVDVTLRPRGSCETKMVRVAWVINCTGPDSNLRTLRDPLLDSLQQNGLVRPDPLALGLDTSDELALLDTNGTPSRVLYHVGPFLKSRYWEATAVPELRVHAARAAQAVLNSL